ncbi:MAG: twin-arginine translocation pathway signal protein, partial [Proteobacteria bacterium]|nr:twin-arginine translocation pathway signal protein [Pseudomonadota bacterium]
MNPYIRHRSSFTKKSVFLLITLFITVASSRMFAGTPGGLVDPMKLMTSSAAMDPVRPEAVRVITEAFRTIGWDVEPEVLDYNQNVQKVVLQHDYDMWFVMLSGASARIDPNVFLNNVVHSSQYKKGGFNWEGFNNPEVDRLAEAQAKAMDPKERVRIVRKAQKLVHELQPLNVVANVMMTNAYRSDRLANITPMMGEGIGSFWSDINMKVMKGSGYVCTAIGFSLKTLNPVSSKDAIEFMTLRMIYDRLFRIGLDGAPKLWAAESYSVSNQKNINVVLKKGMKWHDGRPVTAKDVKFTFDYYIKWKSPYFLKLLKNL